MSDSPWHASFVRYLFAGLVGILFGGAVEHLGSLAFGPWGWTASRLSAPWLLLPFAFGSGESRAFRAAGLGLVATLSGVVGYVLMLSMAAGASHGLTAPIVLHEASTQARWFIAGTVSGPFYGLLGQRWRRFHWWLSAVLAAGALCLEPLALALVGRTFGPTQVYVAEIVAGLSLGAYFALIARRPPKVTS